MTEQTKIHTKQQQQSTAERPGLDLGHDVAPSRGIRLSSPQADIMTLQRAAGNGAVSQLLQPEATRSEPSVHPGSGKGKPLSAAQRSQLERSAGLLPSIFIQNSYSAQASLEAANAYAAARGSEIRSEPGAFAGARGTFRLAHEVAHVLQQRAPHLPATSPEGAEVDADRFAQAAIIGRQATVQVSTPVGWAYDKKRIRKGDQVVSMLVIMKPKRVIVTMKSGDRFTYRWTRNTIPIGDHTATVTGSGIQVDVVGKTVLYFTGFPNPKKLPFPSSFPLKVMKRGVGGGTGPKGTGAGGDKGKDKTSKGFDKAAKKPSKAAKTSKIKKGDSETTTPVPDATAVPETFKVPVITVKDVNQIEELKKRGLIPAKTADQIKAKLENREQLTFEEAIALLDGLDKVLAGSTDKDKEAKEARESWLKWAKFIEENKDKISGKTKTGAEGITVAEMKEILKEHKEFVGIKDAPARTTKDAIYDPELRKSWNSLQDWEKKLWDDYVKKYGATADVTDPSNKDLRITKAVRFSMALRMSPKYMVPGAAEAAEQLFNDPIFIGGTIAGITVYFGAWLWPEPIFSKAAAAGITIALLAVFSASEIINVASAWMQLGSETEYAHTLEELEKAAENFGNAIGGTGLRVLVMIATVLVGKALPTPKPPPGGGAGIGRVPVGVKPGGSGAAVATSVSVEEAAAVTIKVLKDGTIVIISGGATGAGVGTTAMSVGGAGKGGGTKPSGSKPARKKTESKSKPESEPQAAEEPTRSRTEEVLEEFAEAQGKASRGVRENDILDQWGVREVAKPGGKPIPEKFEVGNFAHAHAEELIPSSRLPRGLNKEVTIELKSGKIRLDRVDFTKRKIYEIKPDTPSQIEAGKAQVEIYKGHMNKEYPGATPWEGEVVTYDKESLIRVLKKIGFLE
jgi:hypothetical protein